MNRKELLLIQLAEEASEVAQMASKMLRFGTEEIYPEQPLTNAERTHIELDDMYGIVRMLNQEFNFNYLFSEDNVQKKINKVNKYAMYSVELGLLEL